MSEGDHAQLIIHPYCEAVSTMNSGTSRGRFWSFLIFISTQSSDTGKLYSDRDTRYILQCVQEKQCGFCLYRGTSSGYSSVHGSLPNQSLFSGFSGGSTGKDLKLDKLHFSAILEMPWSLPRRAETGTRKKEAWMSLLRLLAP